MGSKICMNAACGAATSVEWKKGWALRSGGYANLCCNCGSAYEKLFFCETFHLEQSGWRECSSCNKRLHCGCIASQSLLEVLDYGGVECTSCARSSRFHSVRSIEIQRGEIPNEFSASTKNNIGGLQSILVEKRMDGDSVGEGKLLQLGKIIEASEHNHLPQSQKGDSNASLGQIKQEFTHPIGEASFLNLSQPSVGSSKFAKQDSGFLMLGVKNMHESQVQPSLRIALTTPSETPNFTPPFPGGVVEGKEAPSPIQQSQRSRPILPKPSKTGLSIGSEVNKGMVPQMRVARPPAEGRGRNQLLPRYWPRITDQELQQLSGELNSTIVPLFEKVLSASDAGRIGRLVLPKACAEAYFPPINQSEGLPVKIQDAKGKDWTFQFRFWPNNNSRMYVLEGVTPCIQSMQLQAGDTVIFSRIDPGGKLVIGFRKSSNVTDMQDAETSALPNGALAGETSVSGTPTASGFSGSFPSPKGSKDPQLNALSEHLNLANGDTGWNKSEKHQGRINGDALQQPTVILEKKRTRHIGSKSKRLLMHSEDAMELRLTWEEAQDLLRPPPSVKPSIVTIEDHEFEEYNEPPVFGKRTIFTTRPSGGPEQWAQCDNCSKWRRLPVDVLLPPKWTCAENVWDSSRCSCSAPYEMSPKELENLFRVSKDFKRRRTTKSHKPAQDHEPSGLDALASAAVLGDNAGDSAGETSVGATTKHPRHRDGCTCIVCIQPPSGKGRHKPTCTCNVCMTVKRRFKTLMMRKKIRQSELEVEIAQKDHIHPKDESEMNGTSRHESMDTNHLENERAQSIGQVEVGETSTGGQIDLNCHPDREDLQAELCGVSMMSLVEAATSPLDKYLKQNGLTSLVCEQPAQGTGESDEPLPDERCLESVVWERDSRDDEGHHEPNLD